ncbi:class I SAM-dependent methyltransferase [Stenotrophomonas ginsengisoli]|uniref:class I SAM-dependent methyltransferase n=1 Tax=Stenotrophomonas ginsengisoli TaxID=336566 RepID=UPI00070F527A|nr:methyltransferase domain-containing protein [Stenotrophomonas ginsengisoli]
MTQQSDNAPAMEKIRENDSKTPCAMAKKRPEQPRRILNLGCGRKKMAGAINVDFFAEEADVRHDLDTFPYPFNDGEFDEIHAWNVIEHLKDTISAMNEIHRIAKKDALVHIRVPHFRSACLYEDITHQRGFAWRSFDIFTKSSEIYGEYSKINFTIIERRYSPYLIQIVYKILSKFPKITDNLISKYIPMASIEFTMKATKE